MTVDRPLDYECFLKKMSTLPQTSKHFKTKHSTSTLFWTPKTSRDYPNFDKNHPVYPYTSNSRRKKPTKRLLVEEKNIEFEDHSRFFSVALA